MRRGVLLFLAIVVMAACTTEVHARKWSDRMGHQASGRFIRVRDGQVHLICGNQLKVLPFIHFSDEDQEYIRKKLKASGKKQDLLELEALDHYKERFSASNPLAAAEPEMRVWTDQQGREIKAKFIESDGMQVALELESGKKASVAITRLSAEDQRYVAEQTALKLAKDHRPGGLPHQTPHRTSPQMPQGMPLASSFPQSGNSSGSSVPHSSMPQSDFPRYPEMPQQTTPSFPKVETPQFVSSSGENGSRSMPSHAYQGGPSASSVPPYSHPSFPTYEPQSQKICMSCKKIVPSSTKIGDRCPHCGVRFEFEEDENGVCRDKRGNRVSPWVRNGGFGTIGVFGIWIIVALVRKLASS